MKLDSKIAVFGENNSIGKSIVKILLRSKYKNIRKFKYSTNQSFFLEIKSSTSFE